MSYTLDLKPSQHISGVPVHTLHSLSLQASGLIDLLDILFCLTNNGMQDNDVVF